MARQEHQREDLLRDARALAPRLLLRLGDGVELFVGFRGDSLSLYFDDDPVFHFNERGELRRAFVADRLLKADHGQLVEMTRRRSEEEVTLVSRELPETERQSLLDDLAGRLTRLSEVLAAGRFECVGEEPVGSGGLDRLREWIAHRATVAIADSPHVG